LLSLGISRQSTYFRITPTSIDDGVLTLRYADRRYITVEDAFQGEIATADAAPLRVALVTTHLALKDVPAALTPQALDETLSIVCADLRAKFALPAPRVAVCGLNPHAGEGGLLGTEERDVIDPILDELRKTYPGLSRSEPADTLFARQLRGEFDAVIALYHDQGLAPLKTIDFDEAVNVTLGLPFVRTSPDHGTAFGLAGTGQASPRSFENAVVVARKLVALRA
jgi:4-hydroxythreonine-4-phosphate dehydrogenase